MPDPSNYLIAGQMPFGPTGNPYSGQGIGNLGAAYQQSYQSALEQNKALYSNILGGYQQVMGNQVQAQQGIQQGYGQLQAGVLGGIQGIGASQAQAIQDVYAQQSGQAAQGLTSRGLGNTTVSDSVQRGLTLDQQKAQIALANQMAQLHAGYQSQLGLAGLGQANAANMQNTALGSQQLGWMNTVTSQYPNAQSYNQLAQMAGMSSQADKDRALMQKIGMGAGAGVGGVRAAGGAGFRNSSLSQGDYVPYGASAAGSMGGDFMSGSGGFGGAVAGSAGGFPAQVVNQLQPQNQLAQGYDPYRDYLNTPDQTPVDLSQYGDFGSLDLSGFGF